MKKYVFIVEKTNTGYSAYAQDEDIMVGTTGKNMPVLKTNIVEAFNLLNENRHKKPITKEQIVA